jgi:two-component system, sensor histidine kinase and response regulator
MVLVVDDNADNRALAKATLEDEGFAVTLAMNGEEALASFARIRPQCVLLDIRMPGLDGIATCAKLRALPNGADIPIVFVTAQRDLETFDRAHDAGGDDFITKPFRPSELIARVRTATKLHKLSAERDDLYDLIRRQRDDLMRLQLQKEQLAAFVVHDLKNPVNAIELHGERIVRDRDASARSIDAATKIRSETRALLRMIMNLLDLVKADEGRLIPALDKVSLADLFAEVIDAMRVRAQASQVELHAAAGITEATADIDLIRRVVENLVDNAIRHAPEQTSIRLTSVAVDGGIEIRVADEGSGIPVEQRERVFDRFVQVGDASSSHGGRGLGLAFCKLAVEAHGGRIWIEDASPGAVFCIRLPA